MGRWLAALLGDDENSENATDDNPQNHQNLRKGGFEGFEGSPPSAFPKIEDAPSRGFEGFEGSSTGHIPNYFSLPDRAGWDDEDWQAAFDERAAILEFDEGLPRAAAERQAGIEIAEQRKAWVQ